MSIRTLTLLVTSYLMLRPAAPYFDFYDYYQGSYVRMRILDMTRTFYEEGMQRVKRINAIRLKYSECPLFEMGYVVGEIIERYRKMVELAKYLEDYKSEIFLKRLALVNIMQQTYLEMYHLYNIFHEIPKKYAYTPEYRNISVLFDTTIPALVQTCDEYDQTCRTNTTMTNVWQEILEEREREYEIQKKYKKQARDIRERFFKAFLNGTLEELKKEFAAQNWSMSGIYDIEHVPPGHVPAAPGVHDVYSNPQRGFENLLKWKRPVRPKKRRPYPIEYGWSNEDLFFKGWGPDEEGDNKSYVYIHYVPTTIATTPTDEDDDPTVTVTASTSSTDG